MSVSYTNEKGVRGGLVGCKLCSLKRCEKRGSIRSYLAHQHTPVPVLPQREPRRQRNNLMTRQRMSLRHRNSTWEGGGGRGRGG